MSTYVEKEDTGEVIDIKVLNQEIAETVRKIDVLRASINEIVKEMDGWGMISSLQYRRW